MTPLRWVKFAIDVSWYNGNKISDSDTDSVSLTDDGRWVRISDHGEICYVPIHMVAAVKTLEDEPP